jgi:hypothetical protein
MTNKKLTLSQRVTALEAEVTDIKEELNAMATIQTEQSAMLSAVHDDTHKIVAILDNAKGWAAFVKKHGPRFISFILGALVSTGYMNPEIATQLKHLFGM